MPHQVPEIAPPERGDVHCLHDPSVTAVVLGDDHGVVHRHLALAPEVGERQQELGGPAGLVEDDGQDLLAAGAVGVGGGGQVGHPEDATGAGPRCRRTTSAMSNVPRGRGIAASDPPVVIMTRMRRSLGSGPRR